MGLKCMHLRNVETSVEISDETSFFLETIKNLGQNVGHFGPTFSKTVVAGGGRSLLSTEYSLKSDID